VRLQEVTESITKLYADKVAESFAGDINEQLFGNKKLPKLSKRTLEKMRLEQEAKDKAVEKVRKLMTKLNVDLSDLGYDYYDD
jgi:hypothetical protein